MMASISRPLGGLTGAGADCDEVAGGIFREPFGGGKGSSEAVVESAAGTGGGSCILGAESSKVSDCESTILFVASAVGFSGGFDSASEGKMAEGG
jgi:hypothetical protein